MTFSAGTQFGEMHSLPNPAAFVTDIAGDHIFLDAAGYQVHLSALMSAVAKFVPEFEAVFSPEFQEHTSAMADLIVVGSMKLVPRPSDVPSGDSAAQEPVITHVTSVAFHCRPPILGTVRSE